MDGWMDGWVWWEEGDDGKEPKPLEVVCMSNMSPHHMSAYTHTHI
jgi:hypothetical protein